MFRYTNNNYIYRIITNSGINSNIYIMVNYISNIVDFFYLYRV